MNGDLYYLSTLISGGLIVILTALDYVLVRVNGKRRIKKTGIAIIALILISIYSGVSQKRIESYEKKKSDTLDSNRYDSIKSAFRSLQNMHDRDSITIYKIHQALEDRGMKFDGNTIISIQMPNAKIIGGNNQFGNGNTQNNTGK